MDFATLAQALIGEQTQKELADRNPFLPLAGIGDQVGQVLVTPPKGSEFAGLSTRDRVLGSLFSGLAGGLFTNLSDSYADKQNNSVSSILFGGAGERPSNVPPKLFSQLKNTRDLVLAQDFLERSDSTTKARSEDKKLLLDSLKSAKGKDFDRMVGAAKALGIDVGELEAPAQKNPEPILDIQNKPQPLFPGSGSLSDKMDSIVKEQMEQGVPGGAAVEMAKAQTDAYRLANKESVDKVEAARVKAAKLNSIADTAIAGIEGAGQTGGALNTPRELLSSLWSIFSEEEQKQRVSQELLESVAPEVASLARVPGTGATSDMEFKAFLGSGPSKSKLPETNRLLATKAKQLAGVEADYGNFLEAYRAEKGTTAATADAPGAEQLWQLYKKSNPIFVRDQSGELVINENRTPWQQFDFLGSLQQGQRSGGASGTWDSPQTIGATTPPKPLPGESREAFKARVRGMGL